MMKIVVCVKQVPATTEVKIDPETKRLIREGIEIMMNPFDTYALEEALLLRERYGGEVIALSMGPKKAEKTLREAIACGADRAVLLNDRLLAGSDTFATSYALAMAVKKIGDVNLVICGKQAIDGDTTQVGPGIAAHLGWPQVTYVSRVVESGESSLVLERMYEDGYSVCSVELPAVITVLKDINSPRVPTLRGRLFSRKINIPIWDAASIGAQSDKVGLNGSPTRVVSTKSPEPRNKETIVLQGDLEYMAEEFVKIINQRMIF